MSDKRNERRRNRYARDEWYRERVKEIRRKSYKSSMEPLVARDPKKLEPDAKSGNTDLFHEKKLAYCLHKSVQTVRLWISKRFIPDTPFRDENGTRFYTLKMIEDVVEVVGVNRRIKKLSNVYVDLEKRWSDTR